jgi:hypothetical protein
VPEPRIGRDEIGVREPEVGSALRGEPAMLDGPLPLPQVAVKVAEIEFPVRAARGVRVQADRGLDPGKSFLRAPEKDAPVATV